MFERIGLHFRKHRVTLLLFSVALGMLWGTLDMPLLERHGFRQTQTAITVQAFLQEGVSVFSYKTPVLGHPYTVPFEFPLFQLSAYMVHGLIGGNLDVSLRLASLIWFLVSAVLLERTTRLWLRDPWARCAILGFYLLNPYSLLWSRTSMIDFCAVTFTLAYLLASMRWLQSPGWKAWLLAVGLGSLAYLAKATSVLPAAIVLGGYWLSRNQEYRRGSDAPSNTHPCALETYRLDWKHLLPLAILVIVPLAVGYLWVLHTDAIKIAGGQGWLTSGSLKTWNFGTWEQKTNLTHWGTVFSHITSHATPWALGLLFLVPLLDVKYLQAEEKSAARLCLLAGLATQFTYFNLYYVHDYYAIALMPYVAVVCGLGILALIRRGRDLRTPCLRLAFLGAFGLVAVASYRDTTDYLKLLYGKARITYSSAPVVRLGRYLEQITTREDTLIVTDNDWSSDVLYYANRRGLMLRADESLAPGHPDRERTRILASRVPNNYPKLFGSFPRIEFLKGMSGFYLYAVSSSGTFAPSITQALARAGNRRDPVAWQESRMVACNIEKVEPQPAPSIRTEVWGWAFADPSGTRNQTVVMLLESTEGVAYFFEAESVDRPDVCDHFKNGALLRSGFRCKVRSSDLPAGHYSIRALVSQGSTFVASTPTGVVWIP